MRSFAFLLALLVSASAWGQTPPTPNPSPQSKATPQPQPPVTQLYRLVPVDQPTQPQYQTVQLAQQPQYQTVQLAQQPVQQYQTVQLVQQPVQQVSYVPATTSTFAMSNTGQRTVVLGPGLVSLSLARTGQMLTNTFGKTHVWNIQHSVVRPQQQPSPPVQQLVTVSMPVQQPAPPVQVQMIQQPVTQQYKINAPSEEAPPPPVIQRTPTATPQSSSIPPPKHHLFGMLGN